MTGDEVAPLGTPQVGTVGTDPVLLGAPAADQGPGVAVSIVSDMREVSDPNRRRVRLMLALRFWEQVDHYSAGPDGCWLWTGRHRAGYGIFRLGHCNVYAHRLSWEWANDPIPPGLCILHRCDTPLCVNPAHLFLGTMADNMADMIAKGRDRQAIGEAAPTAKLTETDVLEIRRLHAIEGLGCRRLSKIFGVGPRTTQRILNRRTWRHI